MFLVIPAAMEISVTSHLCFCTSSLSSLPRHLSSSSSSSSSSYSPFSPFRARVHALLLASNSTANQKRYGQRPCTVFSQQQGDERAQEKEEEEKKSKTQEVEARKQTHEIEEEEEEEDGIPDTYKQLAVLMEVEGYVYIYIDFGLAPLLLFFFFILLLRTWLVFCVVESDL